MTLYVESNFVLEIAMGQEEFAPAERLLTAAEHGDTKLALPAFSLSESLTRVVRGIRDRDRLTRQLDAEVLQLGRSAPHQEEVGALKGIPNLVSTINEREMDRLTDTMDRLLRVADSIELSRNAFRDGLAYRARFRMDLEDAIILAIVIRHLEANQGDGPHVFANRNRKDFNQPEIVSTLTSLGCTPVWSFGDALRVLGIA